MEVRHNSHQDTYRRPFGAQPVGGRVHLALDVRDGGGISGVSLRIWQDGVGETLLPMQAEALPDGMVRWAVDVPLPDEPGLLWYYFLLRQADGSVIFYGCVGDGTGGAGHIWQSEPPSWQITVYRPQQVPEWFRRAICYQIFPDRFARGDDWWDCQQRAELPADWHGSTRLVQQGWYDTPFYGRGPRGEVIRWPFAGGNLRGIRGKLLYLKSLGVSAVYLNPIFLATSNHKYDTADYHRIDPSFGDAAEFRALAADAARLGIRLILDGVFSHTGADSVYFNKFANFPGRGAYQGVDSPYHHWYKFGADRDDYACWWGVGTLPEVDENVPDYRDFIFGGADSVVRRWLREGASGWRLDVADELPDSFICGLRAAAREEKPDALILGEVWEDASNKQSYGESRKYLLGGGLDGVMNYPFRRAAVEHLLGRLPAAGLAARLLVLQENYPPTALAAALNLAGTHDTPRVLTVLGEAPEPDSEAAAAAYRLPPDKLELAKRRLKLLVVLQFAMPGVPCIYYGDEAGVQGFTDPLNRATYPWGREDGELLAWYRRLAMLRQEYPLLIDGECRPLALHEDVYACRRWQAADDKCGDDTDDNGEEIWLLLNRSDEARSISLPLAGCCYARELLSGRELTADPGQGALTSELPGLTAELWLCCRRVPDKPQMQRAAGVLCHVTSLPQTDGGWTAAARRFVDLLQAAGQKLWQILPLCPVGDSLSPYSPLSVFARHEGLGAEALAADGVPPGDMAAYREFCRDNADWLDDFALYQTLRQKNGGAAWQDWPEQERDRHDMAALQRQYAAEMESCRRRQFAAVRAWRGVREYANSRGVRIIGDLPVYTAADSADTWAHRDLFLLDADGRPLAGAGVPPDYFSAEGQNWGNPLYDWDAMRSDGYRWWLRRLQLALADHDYLRLDHFRSFAAFYAVPRGDAPRDGYWLKGPGREFFRFIESRLGRLPLVAEDLGTLDEDVYTLLRLTGYPGMAVWQFATGQELQGENAAWLDGRVLYSGTHDNQTLAGWLADSGSREPMREAAEVMARLYESAAPWVIVPLQDILGLGDEARMNVPGIPDGNWHWRADWRQFSEDLPARLVGKMRQVGR